MEKRSLKLAALFLALGVTVVGSEAQSLRPTLDTQAIVGARVVVKPGQTIENATILMRGGRIVSVGEGVVVPTGAEVTSGKGLTVYAGFVDCGTSQGLQAAPATPLQDATFNIANDIPTQMRAWTFAMKADTRAASLLDPENAIWATYRSSGFTSALVVPSAGVMKGFGSLVMTNGLARRYSVVKPNAVFGLHLDSTYTQIGYPATQFGAYATTRQAFSDLAWIEKTRAAGLMAWDDPDIQALAPVRDGLTPVLVDAGDRGHIEEALRFGREMKFRPILFGCGEAYKTVDAIKSTAASVVVSLEFGAEPMPAPKPDPADAPADGAKPDANAEPKQEVKPAESSFLMEVKKEMQRVWLQNVRNTAVLAHAGVPFALSTQGCPTQDEFFSRLRRAVKEGLPADAALAALTTNPADILGLGGSLGSIEAGKMANLVIFEGDFLAEGVKPKFVFINGAKYDLGNKSGGPIRRRRRRGDEDGDGDGGGL